MRPVLVSLVTPLVTPLRSLTLRADEASEHLARELTCLAVIAAVMACLAVVSAVMLAASLEHRAPYAR